MVSNIHSDEGLQSETSANISTTLSKTYKFTTLSIKLQLYHRNIDHNVGETKFPKAFLFCFCNPGHRKPEYVHCIEAKSLNRDSQESWCYSVIVSPSPSYISLKSPLQNSEGQNLNKQLEEVNRNILKSLFKTNIIMRATLLSVFTFVLCVLI